MDIAARLEVVEEENALLRERVAELERVLGITLDAPLEWGLTGQESRVMGALIARPLVTKDVAMAALYRDFGRDEPEPKIIDVFICKIRKKVRPFGIEIETVWGQGYRIPADQRAALASGAVAVAREAA